jgi:UDP-N-acetylmuramyl pentapeptide phosphotransferase/UDP-N-acetylglucosamine-1-phosphate transferase
MGDAGSMFLGFMLGILSILGGGKLATALLIMGFPVLDAIFVIFMRLLRGTSPFHGDLSHFHHRLLRVGLSPRASLMFNYFFCILFAAIALTLNSTFEKFLAFLGALILMSIIGLIILMYNRSPHG